MRSKFLLTLAQCNDTSGDLELTGMNRTVFTHARGLVSGLAPKLLHSWTCHWPYLCNWTLRTILVVYHGLVPTGNHSFTSHKFGAGELSHAKWGASRKHAVYATTIHAIGTALHTSILDHMTFHYTRRKNSEFYRIMNFGNFYYKNCRT